MTKKARRNLITVILCLASVCMLSAIGLAAYTVAEENNAEKYSADSLMKLEELIRPKDISDSQKLENSLDLSKFYKEMPELEIDGKKFIGIIEFPSLSIQLPVAKELTDAQLKLTPCLYKGSLETGLIIAGHNYVSHFGPIDNLKYGDKVTLTDAEGYVWEYEVKDIETIAGNDVKTMESGGWDLSLFTCTYSGVERFTVRCERIKADKIDIEKE